MRTLDRFVDEQNIEHFRQQIVAERDPVKRAVLERLLKEEVRKSIAADPDGEFK